MWQCPACSYHNDEWDKQCQLCETARGASVTMNPQGSESPLPPVLPPTPKTGQDAPARKLSLVERAAVVVIALSLIVLGGYGYYAWQTGQLAGLGLPLPAPDSSPEQTEAESRLADAKLALPAEHLLALVYNAKLKGMKRFHKYADYLLETEDGLAAFTLPDLPSGGLSPEASQALDELRSRGLELHQQYQAFEDDCQQYGNDDIEQFLTLLRVQFVLNMDTLVVLVGEVYVSDTEGLHVAYGLSDDFPMAVEPQAPEAATSLRQTWAEVVYRHTQHMLDLETAEEQRRVRAHLDALRELRLAFEYSMNDIPPYRMRAGSPDKAGRDTLELLDAYADSLETLVIEFAGLQETINQPIRADKLKSSLRTFTNLAQQYHEYTFTEVYRIYAQDRKLIHPAYQRLKDHYAFVEEHWPEHRPAYQRIYMQYEGEWDLKWGD